MPPNAPPSSRQQAEALIMEADAQGIVVMFRDDLVDILIKEIERADRAEQERDEAKREALRFAETYHDEFNVREGLASDLTVARERIAELEGAQEGGIFVIHFDSRTVHRLGERCATCPPA